MASQEKSQEALVQNDVELEHEEEEEEGGEEDQVEKLKAEVNEMAHIVFNYRTILPDQLKSTLSAVLFASRRPILPTHFNSNYPNPNQHVVRTTGSGNGSLLAGDKLENEKIVLLKRKISSNAATKPIVWKRIKDCMRRIVDLNSCIGIIIHPAFERKSNR